MLATPIMPNESLRGKIAGLQGELSGLRAQVRQMEAILQQHRPRELQIRDVTGKLRRYSALAQFTGTAGDLNYGMPFEVKNVSPNSAAPTVAVYRHSYLRRHLGATSVLKIDGLDDGKGGGHFRVGYLDIIWLEITFENGAPAKAQIQHGGSGWDDFPEPVKFENLGYDSPVPYRQTRAYIAVAQVVENDEADTYDPPGIILNEDLMASQYLNTHLVLLDTCYQNMQCLYPFPSAGPVRP